MSNPSPSAVVLTPESKVGCRAGVVLRRVAGEHMLVPAVTREIDLDSLFLLNAVGVFIWERLDGVRPVRELGAAVAQGFAVDAGRALADTLAFLADPAGRNLVEVA